ncbi:hypothetical protein LINPERHAP2_LOCUS23131 [Linum perenne]
MVNASFHVLVWFKTPHQFLTLLSTSGFGCLGGLNKMARTKMSPYGPGYHPYSSSLPEMNLYCHVDVVVTRVKRKRMDATIRGFWSSIEEVHPWRSCTGVGGCGCRTSLRSNNRGSGVDPNAYGAKNMNTFEAETNLSRLSLKMMATSKVLNTLKEILDPKTLGKKVIKSLTAKKFGWVDFLFLVDGVDDDDGGDIRMEEPALFYQKDVYSIMTKSISEWGQPGSQVQKMGGSPEEHQLSVEGFRCFAEFSSCTTEVAGFSTQEMRYHIDKGKRTVVVEEFTTEESSEVEESFASSESS